ncbi:hypothetical protein [Pseudobutyrivibrio ruminis]|uniref:Uncharacterized protein n=1 Tax=Pseudobutyrivibrio ruminis DSM 9787 TaxID=1123011 RepID=A0A285T8S9_9FIRM|nr:hypothetical protein [Pseudobutyrivibrio ruminis]SOC17779.1 hypothetical protein SAMN02910411_0523 [Pseudobutyrivibrio ruminis DSM 9787]
MDKKKIYAPMVVEHSARSSMTRDEIEQRPLAHLYRIKGKAKGYEILPEECVIFSNLENNENLVADMDQFSKEFEVYQEPEYEIEFINSFIERRLDEVGGPVYSRKLQLYFEKYNDEYRCMSIYHMDMHNLSFEHHADETIKKKCKGSFINMVIVLCEDENGYKFPWYFGTPPSDKCYAKGATPYEALKRLRRNYELMEGNVLRRPEGQWDKVKWFDAINCYADTSLIGLSDI